MGEKQEDSQLLVRIQENLKDTDFKFSTFFFCISQGISLRRDFENKFVFDF